MTKLPLAEEDGLIKMSHRIELRKRFRASMTTKMRSVDPIRPLHRSDTRDRDQTDIGAKLQQSP